MCHNIMSMPDKEDTKTLRRLIGDSKIAIELGNCKHKLADADKKKNEALANIWTHIYEVAVRQAQWDKPIPAEFFVLESEILKKDEPFLNMDQIEGIIKDNKLEMSGPDLEMFLR